VQAGAEKQNRRGNGGFASSALILKGLVSRTAVTTAVFVLVEHRWSLREGS